MEIILKFLWLCLALLGFTSHIQSESFHGANLTVTTHLSRPFTVLREANRTLTGNDRYEGFIVDLVDATSKILQFNYVLKISDDNRFGWKHQSTGKWDGMVGEVISGKADIAAAPLTITRVRETDIDFTYPFLKLEIGMIHKRESSGLRKFDNVEEVASQSEVTYGVTNGGMTAAFFEHSKDPIYSKMWLNMQSTEPSPFVRSNEEGIERVKQGGFVFIGESLMIEYAIQRDCELYQICGLLDSRGFGLAVRQGSSLRDELNLAILELEENGTLLELKNKWWKENRGGTNCHSKN